MNIFILPQILNSKLDLGNPSAATCVVWDAVLNTAQLNKNILLKKNSAGAAMNSI